MHARSITSHSLSDACPVEPVPIITSPYSSVEGLRMHPTDAPFIDSGVCADYPNRPLLHHEEIGISQSDEDSCCDDSSVILKNINHDAVTNPCWQWRISQIEIGKYNDLCRFYTSHCLVWGILMSMMITVNIAVSNDLYIYTVLLQKCLDYIYYIPPPPRSIIQVYY